jgi:L-aspartate oxidase
MGGVKTDLDGRTNLRRLFAAGEVACAGVHGANRLASNSLLEGAVFGARAGAAMREWSGAPRLPGEVACPVRFPDIAEEELRSLAWNDLGIVRSGAGLERAIDRLSSVRWMPSVQAARQLHELRGMHTVALLIARCALARRESRGGHCRSDYPDKHGEFQKHSILSKDADSVEFL